MAWLMPVHSSAMRWRNPVARSSGDPGASSRRIWAPADFSASQKSTQADPLVSGSLSKTSVRRAASMLPVHQSRSMSTPPRRVFSRPVSVAPVSWLTS